MYINLEATRTDGGWMHFKIHDDSYMQLSGNDNKVNNHKNTTISGNVTAQQAILTSSDVNTLPLIITRTGSSWFLGEHIASETNGGCLFKYKTTPGEWWQGVWGTQTNKFMTCFNYKGLTLKSNGSAVLSGSLTQNSDASLTYPRADCATHRLRPMMARAALIEDRATVSVGEKSEVSRAVKKSSRGQP